MNKKLIFLFIALLLPGLIYVFLKMFGSNNFNVVPLFQEETEISANCGKVKFPYVLPEDIFTTLSRDYRTDSLFLIFYEIDSVSASMNDIEKNISQETDGVRLIKIYQDTLGLKCHLLLKPAMDIVLIDNSRRIRGQYNSTDREEIDRLNTELDIMMKKY